MRVPFLALAALFLVAACGPRPVPRTAVLAVGDSVLAWNGRSGAPEAAAAALDRPLRDASRSGARVVGRGSGLFALIPSVTEQWRRNRARWDWVILDGGANDLRALCGTPAEGPALDRLLSPDLTGPLADLIADIRATGSRVAVMGYYPGLRAAETGFTGCGPILSRLDARVARMAARDPGMVFADSGDVIDPTDRAHYARDEVHPSRIGSARIGAHLAAAMR